MTPWQLQPWTLLAIAGMAAATFACRAGGYLIFKQIKPNAAIRAALGYVPGALFVSYVVPGLAAGGPPQWVGAAATLGLMVWSGSLSGSILAGTAAAWAVWSLG